MTEASKLFHAGFKHFEANEFAAALPSLQQALDIYQKLGDTTKSAVVAILMGHTYVGFGKTELAKPMFEKALAWAQKSEDADLIKFAQEGLQSISDPRQVKANQLLEQGIQQFKISQFRVAIQSWQQALELYQEIGDHNGEANSLGNLGIAYRNLGQVDKAVDVLNQQLVIAREIGDRNGEANSLGNLGAVYRNLGQYDKAIDFHQQSLAIKREIGDRNGEANSLGNLGNAYDSLGQYDKAIDFLQQSLAIKREIGDRQGEAKSLGNLGNTYDSPGQYDKAISFLQQQLVITREIGDRPGEAIALNNLGSTYNRMKRYPAAETHLFSAIEIWESLRENLKSPDQVSIFDTQVISYYQLQLSLLIQNKPNRALELAERGRARALVQLLAQQLSPQAAEKLQIELPNIAQIQQLAQQRNATLVEYSLITDKGLLIWVVQPNGEIDIRVVALGDQDPSLPTLEKQTRVLMAKTPAKDPTQNPIVQLVRGTRTTLGLNPIATATPPITHPLKQLHQHLIAPIADLLPQDPNDRVIFIPHRSLFQVPFAALTDSAGDYLIEKHTILTAPSIQALAYTQQHQQRVQGKASEILVVGNPTIPKEWTQRPQPLPALPNAEQEAKWIAQQFQTSPLIGHQATETAVKQRLHSARIIHLAVHSILNDDQGKIIPGFIVLADSAQDDGSLTTGELISMTENNPLNAEMVVLSACQTGGGKITGDGVVGLS